jgi:hypothetical protein
VGGQIRPPHPLISLVVVSQLIETIQHALRRIRGHILASLTARREGWIFC